MTKTGNVDVRNTTPIHIPSNIGYTFNGHQQQQQQLISGAFQVEARHQVVCKVS